jgi:hypothetical protein
MYGFFFVAEVVTIGTRELTPSAIFFVLSVVITLELVLPLLSVNARK